MLPNISNPSDCCQIIKVNKMLPKVIKSNQMLGNLKIRARGNSGTITKSIELMLNL